MRAAMMAFTLAFITAGLGVRLHDAPEPTIAAKPAANSSLEPLVRSYTPDQARKPEARPLPEPQAEPEHNSDPKPAP